MICSHIFKLGHLVAREFLNFNLLKEITEKQVRNTRESILKNQTQATNLRKILI